MPFAISIWCLFALWENCPKIFTFPHFPENEDQQSPFRCVEFRITSNLAGRGLYMNASVGPQTPSPCLLTPQGGGYYAGKPGQLHLILKDVKGTTQLNCTKSVVTDITNPAAPLPVTRNCTTTTLAFTIVTGKTYRVQLECSQVPAYDSQATLSEACGQQLLTIDVTNVVPALVVSA